MIRSSIAQRVSRRFLRSLVPFERGDLGLSDYQTALGDDQYRGPSTPVRFHQTPYQQAEFVKGYYTEDPYDYEYAWMFPIHGDEIREYFETETDFSADPSQ